MPRLKKDTLNVRVSPADASPSMVSVEVEFHVNSQGEFYCEIPEEALAAFTADGRGDDSERVTVSPNRAKRLSMYASTLDDLYGALKEAIRKANEPIISEEVVILYNIESHVSFAVDEHGEIARNAKGNARWVEDKHRFGDHHAARRADGGYSLTIGAKVVTQMIVDYGDRQEVVNMPFKPERECDDEGNLHPGLKLNEWGSFRLPENAKRMPYSDQAARFFDDLMFGMAKLSKLVQEKTFDQEDLMALIQSNQGLLPGSERR